MIFRSISNSVSSSSSSIKFNSNVSKPLTVSTSEPFKRIIGSGGSSSSSSSFTIKFNTKDARTAIGYCFRSPPITTYLTPDYTTTTSSSADYISYGGAGFIYPIKARASKGYGNGDTITTTIDWDSNTITYTVNNTIVYSSSISSSINIAYPCISSEGGIVDVSVSFN